MKSPRWETIGKIVTTYIEKGHPGYALAALALLLLAGLAAIALAYVIGTPIIAALR